MDVEALLQERQRTLADFRDPRKSPLAAVARHDFAGDRPLTVGGDAACDVVLEGAAPRALQLRAGSEDFEVTRDGRTERVRPGTILELGRYALRLSHQNFPAMVVLDSQAEGLRKGPFPRWFDPDPAARVEARLVRDPSPREETVLSTRGNRRRALRLGRLEFTLQGRKLALTALRLLEAGASHEQVSVFFRDASTGKESYPVGRYIDAEKIGPDLYLLDFNRAYNPACAFSPLYNCPIPPRENVLAVAVRAGERDPGGH